MLRLSCLVWQRRLVAGLCAAGLASAAAGADLSATGNWSPSLRSSDLPAGAGGALRSSIDSPAGQVVLTISNAASSAWTIMVRNDGAPLPAGVQLAVRVAATGSGSGPVSASGAYLRLDGSSQALLSGSADRSGVQLQFRLDGTSVRNPVGNYSATLIYSLQ